MRALVLLLLWLAGPALAQAELRIGYLGLIEDPRYHQDWGYARLVAPPPVLTEQAARMAVSDLAFLTDTAGVTVSLDRRKGTPETLLATLDAMREEGVSLFVLDLPEPQVRAVAAALSGTDAVIINATAPENRLRSACLPNLLHSGPSLRIMADAMAQHLRAMNWTRALVLEGEDPGDKGLADAFIGSAERLRINIADRRSFTLSRDPSRRDANNVRLLTSGARYDVVFVADTRGEFGRYIPYATQDPRPVIGSVGLVPLSWHWAMERDGATQVSSRFDRTFGRRMSAEDWNVWIAVKSLVSASVKTCATDPKTLKDYITSPRFRLDGSKGITLNYRPWNGQLRMPILLATSEAVIAVAPVAGFEHRDNRLDSLGSDVQEFACD